MDQNLSKLIDIINLDNYNNYLINENDLINIDILAKFLKNNLNDINYKLDYIYYYIISLLIYYGLFISEPSESEINTLDIYYYLKYNLKIIIDLHLLNQSYIRYLSYPFSSKILDFLFHIKSNEMPYFQKNFEESKKSSDLNIENKNDIKNIKDDVNLDEESEILDNCPFKNKILRCKFCCFQ